MRRLALLATLALLLLAPRLAEACPQCAGRSAGSSLIPYLIGSLVLFPFAVVYVIHRIIKKAPPGVDPRTLG
ncbi:MAG: hypothetical protein IT370_20870 [Deltaproteobacteria bacterium]|nr:hypothetical protein [Deltaproteobacteria bacterium]